MPFIGSPLTTISHTISPSTTDAVVRDSVETIPDALSRRLVSESVGGGDGAPDEHGCDPRAVLTGTVHVARRPEHRGGGVSGLLEHRGIRRVRADEHPLGLGGQYRTVGDAG